MRPTRVIFSRSDEKMACTVREAQHCWSRSHRKSSAPTHTRNKLEEAGQHVYSRGSRQTTAALRPHSRFPHGTDVGQAMAVKVDPRMAMSGHGDFGPCCCACSGCLLLGNSITMRRRHTLGMLVDACTPFWATTATVPDCTVAANGVKCGESDGPPSCL